MSTSPNPYASPAALPEGTPAGDPPTHAAEPWKAIARRWELLRLPYNLIVGVCGLVVVMTSPKLGSPEFILFYGLAANGCYLFGPLTEMYLNWMADALAARGWAMAGVQLIRSPHTTMAMFLAGLLFSVALTFAVGAAASFEPF